MLANSQGRGLIIFPIAIKLFQSVMFQQRPKSTGGRRIASLPVLPWNVMNRPTAINFGSYNLPPVTSSLLPINFSLCATNQIPILLTSTKPSTKPSVVHRIIIPADTTVLIGISKDNLGAILPNCIINLFRVDYDSGGNKIYEHVSKVISDANGNFSFNVNTTSKYRITADSSNLAVAGVSFDTLIGV